MSDSELEQRLRGALAARADQITPGRLQPAVPPTVSARPGLAGRVRWWMPALAGAALITAVVLTRLPGPDAVAPTGPAVTAPAPSAATSAPGPAPSSAAAGPVPTASAGADRPTTVPSATGERVLVPAH